MSKPIFYEGQAVGSLMFGEGIIQSIGLDFIHVIVKEVVRTHFVDGKYHQSHERATLYPIEQYREIIKNLPAPEPEKWQPKEGEWCWFWNNYNSYAAVIAKFAEILNKKYMAKINSELVDYPNCAPFIGELPEHLKEVKS